MSRFAIFLTTDGHEVGPESLRRGLREGGFRVGRALTHEEARELFEALGAEGEGLILSAHCPLPAAPPPPPSPAESPVRSLLMEMLMHQLTNIVKDQEAVMSTLVDLLKKGEVDLFETQINSMHEVSKRHLDMLNLMSDVTTDDQQGPCLLLEAINRTCDLLSFALQHRQIEIHVDVEPHIALDVSLQSLVMVLYNLVGNAKDAIAHAREQGEPAGKIHIKAEVGSQHILCRVTDDGVGVPEGLRERIFEAGVTTKETKGGRRGGHGLPLSLRALDGSGANIELTGSKPGDTVFTIRFPYSAKEEK